MPFILTKWLFSLCWLPNIIKCVLQIFRERLLTWNHLCNLPCSVDTVSRQVISWVKEVGIICKYKRFHQRWHITHIIIYTIILHKSVCPSVGVRKLQVAILARSFREIYLTDRIVWQYILSRVRVSVQPSNFVYAKNNNKLPRKPTFAYLTVEWISGAAGHNALSDGHGWMASDPSPCRYNCGNT